MKKALACLFIISCFFYAGAVAQQTTANKKKSSKQQTAVKKRAAVKYGIASYYHKKFSGRKTASGDTYKHHDYTAASNSFPLNTWVRVTNLRNRKTVIVKINDRLHKKNKRLIDLSRRAAEKLGFISRGITRVKVEVLPGFKRPLTTR